MEVLPDDVMIDILSRLPVKTIIHCRRVCKKWRNLILDSSFVNLHLSRSPTSLIIHYYPDIYTPENDCYVFKRLGVLNWVEIEDKVDHHHLHHDPLMSIDLKSEPILQNSEIDMVGSVNGLICLWQYYPKHDNTCICNPMTGEYMMLPTQQYNREGQGLLINVYGFGMSSLTGEYKVVRTFRKDIPPNGSNSSRPSVLEAEVYTLGTRQWRSLGRVPYLLERIYGPFLNDHCHWIVCDKEDSPEKLCTFDLNKETIQLFPSPPSEAIQESPFQYQSLAVLKGCLCKLDTTDSEFTIWVMKEYGIKKSWHKEVVITQAIGVDDLDWPFWGPISLIEGLKDGSILMCFGDEELCAYYPHTKATEFKEMFGCQMSGLAYRPSFLRLQNFVSGSKK